MTVQGLPLLHEAALRRRLLAFSASCTCGLHSLDIFGQELPSFNLKGNPGIKTVAGGLMTILIMVIAILYASMRLVILVNGDNPQINIFTSRNLVPNDENLNLNDINYRMAFVEEGFAD